ncbi:hypothetical protein [Flindersiella endophytica]
MQQPVALSRRGNGVRTRRLALYVIAVLVVAGTVTAFVQSYEGLYGWASRYLSPGWARTWPLQVDAWIAVGELALYVGYRDNWPARRKVWPWVAAITGLAASTGFNVGHMAATDLPGRLTAAVPPIAAFGGLYLGLQVLKQIEDSPGDMLRSHGVSVASAVQLAATLVATDRIHARRPSLAFDQPDRLDDGQAASASDGHSPASGRRFAAELEKTARHIMTQDPGITGAELARQLGVPERTGGRVLKRVRHTDKGSSRS